MNKWDLTKIYKDRTLWEKDFNHAKTLISKLKEKKGTLNTKKGFKEYIMLEREATLLFYKTYFYSHLLSDLNKKNNENTKLEQHSEMLMHAFIEGTSWVTPEEISIGEEKILSYLEDDPILKEYHFPIKNVFHTKKYILDEKSEWLIANFNSVPGGDNLYSNLAVSDNYDNEVTLSDQKTIKVTQGNYRSLLADLKNPNDRKLVFEAIFKKFEKNKNTYAAIYYNVLKNDWANAKARGYLTSLDSFLYKDNIPSSVYTSLIKAAKDGNSVVKKYLDIKKKYLKLDEYHTYDRFLELATSNHKYPFDDAKKLFLNAIKDYPMEFVSKQKMAVEDGYVDVFEQDGKRTGAYSSSVYPFHPYILLNHDETLDSAFTLAHEAGHSAHSIFSNESQPLPTSDYRIFVAEIASTLNEHILLDYLVKNSNDKNEKIKLLQKAIDDILSTFYRQTLFAEYEHLAHQIVENDEPITEEVLSNIMIKLYDEYYGLDITKETYKQYVWAYIPHFYYSPYYVYQYATSFSASLKIYANIKTNEPNAFTNYLNLLKSGGSDFPIELVKKAGIDLSTPAPFMAVIDRLDELVTELANTLKN